MTETPGETLAPLIIGFIGMITCAIILGVMYS